MEDTKQTVSYKILSVILNQFRSFYLLGYHLKMRWGCGSRVYTISITTVARNAARAL